MAESNCKRRSIQISYLCLYAVYERVDAIDRCESHARVSLSWSCVGFGLKSFAVMDGQFNSTALTASQAMKGQVLPANVACGSGGVEGQSTMTAATHVLAPNVVSAPSSVLGGTCRQGQDVIQLKP